MYLRVCAQSESTTDFLDLTADRKKKHSENCSLGKWKVKSTAIQRGGRENDHEAIRAAQGQHDSFDCSAERVCLVHLGMSAWGGLGDSRDFPCVEINYSLSSQPCISEGHCLGGEVVIPGAGRAMLGG